MGRATSKDNEAKLKMKHLPDMPTPMDGMVICGPMRDRSQSQHGEATGLN